jgi:hypothetical protein
MNNENLAIVKHPYMIRHGKQYMLVENATVDSVNTLLCLLDIAENMCVCNDELFEKLLPVFKEFYSLIGDAKSEVKFIKNQRRSYRS